jgi:hypothetical protein
VSFLSVVFFHIVQQLFFVYREQLKRVRPQLLLHLFALWAQHIKQGENSPHFLRC